MRIIEIAAFLTSARTLETATHPPQQDLQDLISVSNQRLVGYSDAA
jgi:hypothetical protein